MQGATIGCDTRPIDIFSILVADAGLCPLGREDRTTLRMPTSTKRMGRLHLNHTEGV